MIKFAVKETVSDYLKKLDELAHNTTNQTRFLKTAASEMHFEYVEPLMPTWNPNLIFSPLERRYQKISSSETSSSIELIYTGFTEEEESYGLDKIYREFVDASGRHLARDYAYYQETGADPDAPNFTGHHFVGRGTLMYQSQYYMSVLYYLDDVMNLKGHENRNFVDLYDYQERFF